MNKFFHLFAFLFVGFALSAQFVNNGATVTIQPGATLRVETHFLNNSGTVTNNGTLEVQDSFKNNATFVSGTSSIVRFVGVGDSKAKSGTATLRNVEMSKTTGGTVTLVDPMTVSNDVTFVNDNNKIILGDQNFRVNNNVVSADPNEYFVAVGSGQLVKPLTIDASVNMEVGDLSNYSPIFNVVDGTSYSGATLSVNVVDAAHPNKPSDASDYLTRYWNVDVAGVTTPFENTMTGTYATTGDLVGLDASVKGASYITPSDWLYLSAAEGTNTVTGKSTSLISDFTGTNAFGKVNLTAFLAGALPSGTTMTTSLNSILPLTTPYTVAPFNAPSVTAPSIPVTAVDWILVETRDGSNPATVVAQKSAFLLNSGSIVNPDGTPLSIKDATGTYHVALRHRNHLSIRTNTALNLGDATVPTHNFSTSLGQAYTDTNIPNANMRNIGGVFCLWNGDTNQNGNVLYSGSQNDSSPILSKVGGTANATVSLSGYWKEDVDLSGSVLYSGSGNDRTKILSAVGGSANATISIVQHQ